MNGANWATQSGANTIAPFASYTANLLASGSHTDYQTATTLGAAASTSTLRFNTPAANTLNFGANTLTLEQGGLLITPAMAAAATTISNGTLTGAAVAGSELIVHQHNLGAPVTISAVIANNGANATGPDQGWRRHADPRRRKHLLRRYAT